MDYIFNLHSRSSWFELKWEDMCIYCPRCGAYHGTKMGLQTNETSRNCVGWCESITSQSKFIMNAWWGEDFPVRYNMSRILKPYRSNTGIINRLKNAGYTIVQPSEVPGLDIIEQDGWIVSKNMYRRDYNDSLICSEDRFVHFAEKNKPIFLEIQDTVDGVQTVTYLKYEEISIIQAMLKNVRNILSSV